jgi:asparagine N-glycosylation enzyme membrane subunit Stt3
MAIVAYFFSKEIWDSDAVIVAAVLIAICPCYISKLVVGEQDFTCSSKKARVRNGVYGTKA